MELLTFILKLLLILLALFVLAVPFLMEYLRFFGDKAKKISYKRFRIVIFTLTYIVAVTVLLYVFKELLVALESTSFVQWLTNKLSLAGKTVYGAKVFVVILVNFAIGLGFVLLQNFVRIGLKKRREKKEEDQAEDGEKLEKENEKKQKLDALAIKIFHNETWFFVAKILKVFNLLLSAVYAVQMVLYLLPVLFGADWLPYDFISMLFEAGHIYPVLTLLGLWEAYFFLAGIERYEDECPDDEKEEESDEETDDIDLEQIDEELRRAFSGTGNPRLRHADHRRAGFRHPGGH